MKEIIAPVEKSLLREEFSRATELEEASRGNMKVFCVDASFPAILRETGRLREIAFRAGGGGTGMELDLDKYDTDPAFKFKQLVVWDADDEAIAGGYRFVYGRDILLKEDGQPDIPSAHIFRFSPAFMKEVMPVTMELSRSYIVEQHQRVSDDARKSIFILDCLFKGISIVTRDGGIENIFGKVTFYPGYPAEAFALLTAFMKKHCDGGPAVSAINEYPIAEAPQAEQLFTHDDYKADFRELNKALLSRGMYLPPILKSYMNLTATLKYYGAALNDEFGNVVEMAIKLHMPDINPERWPLYFK